jgi:hypothetical protein
VAGPRFRACDSHLTYHLSRRFACFEDLSSANTAGITDTLAPASIHGKSEMWQSTEFPWSLGTPYSLLGETIFDIETIEMCDVTGPREAAVVFLQNQISTLGSCDCLQLRQEASAASTKATAICSQGSVLSRA